MKEYIIIPILVAVLISLSGCLEMHYKVPNGEVTKSTHGAIDITDPELKSIDKSIRPILNNILGGAAPTTIMNMDGSKSITYTLSNKVNAEDYNKLVSAIKEKYNVTLEKLDKEDYVIVFKINGNDVAIGGALNDNKLTVALVKTEQIGNVSNIRTYQSE